MVFDDIAVVSQRLVAGPPDDLIIHFFQASLFPELVEMSPMCPSVLFVPAFKCLSAIRHLFNELFAAA